MSEIRELEDSRTRNLDTIDFPPIRAFELSSPRILSLSTLSLHHFRNYEHLRLDVAASPVVLFGRNGAGKTNILEAISLLIPGRGLRRAKLAEFSRQAPNGNENWAIVAYAQGLQGEAMIATGKDSEALENDRRIVKIDGKITPQSHLSAHMSVLWLTPQMEQLFLEGASDGRKFLDRLTYSFDAQHASHINAYDHAMRERNRLLEANTGDGAWLSSLENAMSEKAANIAAARLATIAHINELISESQLSFPKPHLAMSGIMEAWLQEKTALEAEQHFAAMLADNRRRDAAAGRALAGVHRSEFVVTHRERGMPAAQCSTGEQKALMLSIILAQARACKRFKNTVPIILLDEVVSHLDAGRRIELFEEICDTGAQTWMTGTDASLFAGIRGKAQFFEVESGSIT